MKSQKSNAEIQIEEAINHMNVIIKQQNVRIPDAEYLVNEAHNVLYKCEELRKSRDLAITRRDYFMELLRKEKKTSQMFSRRLSELQEIEPELSNSTTKTITKKNHP